MFDANSLWSEGHRNRSFFRYKTWCIFLYELMEWGKRWYVSNTSMHLFSQAAIRRLSDASWSDNRHLNGRQHWWTGQYVISLWWHEYFWKHMIQSLILGCFFQKKGRTRLSCILDSRFKIPQEPSCWLTRMSEALSVTSQAFHYKNHVSLEGHRMQMPCS